MWCVYALKIKEVIDPLLSGEEGSYVPDMDAGMETELEEGCNCIICTYRSVVTVVVAGVD